MSVDHTIANVKHQSPTCDAFLGGRLSVSQPVAGFRAGTDSVLLGASVTVNNGILLELGAGAGVAAMTAMTYHKGLGACLVERDPVMAALGADNLEQNGFAGRAKVLVHDVTAPGVMRLAAGLEPDHYSCVIANPPFFKTGAATGAPEPARAGARQMAQSDLENWVRTAASCAAPGAEIIFLHTASALALLLGALGVRFGAIEVLPLVPRPGADATRILVRARKGSRAPLRLLSPHPLHGAQGRDFSPAVEAVTRGESLFDWH